MDGVADAGGALLAGAAGMLGFSAVGNIINSLSPTKRLLLLLIQVTQQVLHKERMKVSRRV